MSGIELSEQQRTIVEANDKNIIVDAAAGSGKTRVLTERVRRLLKDGVNPKSMVVITFTNLAADELKQRLKDVKGISQCFVGTIHAYANKILRKSGKQFDIFSEEYQTKFMEYLIPKYAKNCTLRDYEEFVKLERLVASGRIRQADISVRMNNQKALDEILQLLGRSYQYTFPETVRTLCEQNNIISFDDLIKETTEYFNENGCSIEYLFVDEFQDIGYLEYNFLISLNAGHNFVIGDDYQSLYGFKGGDVNIFLSLMKNPEWKSYALSENYRTAKNILMYANSLIKKANDIIPKEVVIMRSEMGSLEFKSKSLLDIFLSEIDPSDDWFILTRSNKEMNQVTAILHKQNIEHYCFKRSTISKKELDEILSKKCIKVMTVHAAKGLECENVALYGRFPTRKFDNSDEVKVLYVGLTRAKNKCVMFV